MTSRTDVRASLVLAWLLVVGCSETEGDGATGSASSSGGGGGAPASSASATTGSGGSTGLTTGVGGAGGGCPTPGDPETCALLPYVLDCQDAGCVYHSEFAYTMNGSECSQEIRNLCISIDQCIPADDRQGYFRDDVVIELDGACGRVLGWTPCSGAPTDPPACVCTVGTLVCE